MESSENTKHTTSLRYGLLNATSVGRHFGISAVRLNVLLSTLNVYNKSYVETKVFNAWFEKSGYGKTIENELGFKQSLFTKKGVQYICTIIEYKL